MQKKWTLMHGMGRTQRAWEDHMKHVSSAVGVPDSYSRIIMFLRRNPGASQRGIADFLNVTASAINQVVKNMLGEGLLRKESDPADGRSFRLFLSEQGEQVAAKLRSLMEESDRAVTEFVGEEKEQELMEFFHQLTEFIKKELT